MKDQLDSWKTWVFHSIMKCCEQSLRGGSDILFQQKEQQMRAVLPMFYDYDTSVLGGLRHHSIFGPNMRGGNLKSGLLFNWSPDNCKGDYFSWDAGLEMAEGVVCPTRVYEKDWLEQSDSDRQEWTNGNSSHTAKGANSRTGVGLLSLLFSDGHTQQNFTYLLSDVKSDRFHCES